MFPPRSLAKGGSSLMGWVSCGLFLIAASTSEFRASAAASASQPPSCRISGTYGGIKIATRENGCKSRCPRMPSGASDPPAAAVTFFRRQISCRFHSSGDPCASSSVNAARKQTSCGASWTISSLTRVISPHPACQCALSSKTPRPRPCCQCAQSCLGALMGLVFWRRADGAAHERGSSYDFAQDRPTPRPAVERIRRKVLLPFALAFVSRQYVFLTPMRG